jgi:MFS transporter, ACS family, glucarate transporter
MVSYIDRSCISVAAPSMRRQFNLSSTQMGFVFSSFFLSYALLQAPWGMMADRHGPRKIVAFAILAWSAFTALTGAATDYFLLLAIRFVFGGMEAALIPSIASAFSRWLSDKWRTTGFGIFLSGGRLGGALAPLIASFLVLRHGWRLAFVFIALLGVLAAWAWLAVTSDAPSSFSVSVDTVQSGPRHFSWRMLALLLSVFGYTLMWQFYSTWYPTYLVERRGFSLAQAASYAAVPFLLGIGSNWVGGLACDIVGRRVGMARARAVLGCLFLVSASILFYCGIVAPARTAPWLLAAAAGVGDLFLPMAWSAATDLGGASAGAVGGWMNSASNLGGFLSPIFLGAAIERWKNWDGVLFLWVGAVILAAIFWLPANGLAKEEEALPA